MTRLRLEVNCHAMIRWKLAQPASSIVPRLFARDLLSAVAVGGVGALHLWLLPGKAAC